MIQSFGTQPRENAYALRHLESAIVSKIVPIRLNGRDLKPHKAIVAPLLGTRTVLTNSPWGFVSLWLKRHGKEDALFFWDQARDFYTAAVGMTLQSSPLLLYYSFMNATKALLVANGINFSFLHGIGGHTTRKPQQQITLANEGVRLKLHGVLPALSQYLGETEIDRVHSLQDLFGNLPYIHRTYCLTYKGCLDMFIPLTRCQYILDQSTMLAYLRAQVQTRCGM